MTSVLTTAPPTTTVAARAVDAVKVYGTGVTEVRALDGVSVGFEAGRLPAIMGPSGSGKSVIVAVGVVGGVIAAIRPAWRAAHLDVLRAIASE